MKKVKYLSLVLLLMLVPILNINAEGIVLYDNESEGIVLYDNEGEGIEVTDEIKKFNVVAEENVNEDYQVDGSSMIFGNNVDVTNTIKGIDMVFGNSINYNSNSDYSLVMGNVINIKGITKNDGFIFGNIISFDKDYVASRDLFVFGNSVTLRGEITRDVTIYASTVILEDVVVNGNVTIDAAVIEVKNATVAGTLSYNEIAEMTMHDEAIINEQNTFESETIEISLSDMVLNTIIDYASILVTFAALALILPGMFNKLENKLENISVANFLSMLGYGLLFLIFVPIVFIILLMITVGVPLALLLLTLYIVVICLSTIFTGYFVGLMVWNKFIKKEKNMLLVGLIGISIVKVLTLIPFVNTIVTLISLLLSLSIVAKLFTKDA